MKISLQYILVMLGALCCIPSYAQDSLSDKGAGQYLDLRLDVANNHLWRGIEVSDGLVMLASVAVHDKSERFKLGVWGGSNTSGQYKEFNFFGELNLGAFGISLWDIYNFSPGAGYNNREFFNYNARTTGRFLDCNLSCDLGKTGIGLPLTLQWSTILFGRDRGADNSGNRYSSYVYAEYLLLRSQGWRADLGVGGAFTLASKQGDSSTFYSDKPGIIHIQLRVEHDIRISSTYTFPVFARAVFNPVMDRAFLQIGARVLSF
ncbi:hypothetical protein [Porphyromonas macacae]|uniref:Uncharacterized protein n=1 Tax=Porphyromonas macacae TaxID=28115 RepID=A0A379DHY9_9PORP|nr:hypothetical protein [Porphyromonas macacae]SUB77335.1 Uncharacterised protein [Porphyromonas macacae]